MAKPSQKSDSTKDPKFQGVVRHFLETPPRQHKEDVGKKRSSQTGAPGKGKAKQKQRGAR